MRNDQKAEYIFQQLVERGAPLPHTAVMCIENALNDLDIEAAQQCAHPTNDGRAKSDSESKPAVIRG